MLVKELDISEFRGIKSLVKPIRLSRFNVLVGRNSVGKTAVLEALHLLSMPFNYAEPPYNLSVIDFIGHLHGGKQSLVYGYAGIAKLRYRFDRGITFTKSTGSVVTVSSTELRVGVDGVNNVFLNEVETDLNDYKLLLKSLGVRIDKGVLSVYIPNDSRAFESLRSFVFRDDVWSWIEKEGIHSRVVKDVVLPAVYDRFTEVIIKKNRLCIRKEVSSGGPLYIDIDSLGEGVKRVVLTYLVIEYLKPKIVLWDDLEVAAHPSLINLVIKWLARSERQVIISTHSLDVLYSVSQVRPNDCSVLLLRKSPDDVVSYESLSLDRLDELLSSSIDVRKVIDELGL